MINLKSRYKKSPSIISREIKEDIVLVPLCQDVADLESIYILTPMAGWIWKRIDGRNTLSQILDAVTLEFQTSKEKAGKDLSNFIAKLKKAKAITKSK